MSVREIFDSMEYGPAPESAAYAKEWLDQHGGEFGHFIGGEWTPGSNHFEAFNPAKGTPIARVALASAGEVDAAVRAARQALGPWQALSGRERAEYLYAIARKIQKHSRLLAVIETLDNGKPIRETRDIDIPLVARHFYYHAGWATVRDTELIGYSAVGVCGQIVPWNFPLLMLAWKIAPALAMGNTVVLKPAEFTSLSALLFAEICAEVGLPAGVVNIVTGDGTTGAAIVDHPDVDKIAFTGSTEVGRILRKATAGTPKKLSLELGGKSPFIVCEDADLDAAVEGLVDAIWFNQGQVCCAGSRLLVQEGVAEIVLAKTKARMENLVMGDPLDKAIDLGAIVAPVQRDRIDELVKQSVSEGAEMFQPSCPCPAEGWFYPPTLLTGIGPASMAAQVEIFGPVLAAMTFKTVDEAVALANNTVYGLAASVWSENLNRAFDIAHRVKAGTVWVNCTNQFDAACGFGGYRESGFGREGGREGLYEYLKPCDFFEKSAPVVPQFTTGAASGIDRTHKHYIGGKQVRPDGGYSLTLETARGPADVARGNRKDVRDAVEAAESASGAWSGQTGHAKAQILYYLAENLSAQRSVFESALMDRGASARDAKAEFDLSLDCIFTYAAMADKYDGATRKTLAKGLTYTVNEPIGVAAVVCPDESPLLGFLSLILPLVTMGNAVVAIPSEQNPLPVCELYRVVEASDLPGGVLNILTGARSEMVSTLAEHDGVHAMWHFADAEGGAQVQRASAHNLKQTWCSLGAAVNWSATPTAEFLRRSVQIKNIWAPFGA